MTKDINEISKEALLRIKIGENLKRLRKNHDVTQEKLAQLTGINRITITRYENCQMLISLKNLLNIAKALEEEPMAILEGWERFV